MRIAIVGINYAPEATGIPVYTTGLAEHLANCEHEVTVYTGFPYYPHWKKRATDSGAVIRREAIGKVDVRRHYLYVPASPTALRRIIHEASFVTTSAIGYALGPRAKVTIIISPPLLLGLPIALIAWFKRSKTIFHVQDLQPDAAVDLGMLSTGPLTRFLYGIERSTYRFVDWVSSISRGMVERIQSKGISAQKVILLRNWANDDLISPLDKPSPYRDEWNLSEKFVVLYSGNMGVKQGLGTVLDCAELLRDQPEIAFVLVGDGGERAELEHSAQQRNLTNVRFEPLQPIEKLSELLATADVSLAPQKPGIRDIVLPSKLANILASGRPVIAAAARETDFGILVEKSGAGTLVEPGDPQALATAITYLRDNPSTRAKMGRKGREYMLQELTADAILGAFERDLKRLSGVA